MNTAREARRRVPAALLVLLAASLSAQIALKSAWQPAAPEAADLPPAPGIAVLRLASLGEPQALSRLLMLYLQAFDFKAGNRLPYRQLDYDRLSGWLGVLLALDPRGQYPLFSAARIYAEISDPVRQRKMLEFIYAEFFRDPNRRWPWLAHASLVAKHQLKDLALARKYAVALDKTVTARDIPAWATQMEIFILEDMNELEAAMLMIGGLVASGKVTDPAELRFLEGRIKELEKRLYKR
ncbi:MAG: hypothetical protein HY017_17150 [Betaproteobacteria bacterium]|nr:hypothetical protein [Betaproteobacteria bacterium]